MATVIEIYEKVYELECMIPEEGHPDPYVILQIAIGVPSWWDAKISKLLEKHIAKCSKCTRRLCACKRVINEHAPHGPG